MTRLSFNYQSKEYDALVRDSISEGRREFHVTIMDGELEKVFYPFRIIKESELIDGCDLHPSAQSDMIKAAIINALRRSLSIFSNLSNQLVSNKVLVKLPDPNLKIPETNGNPQNPG